MKNLSLAWNRVKPLFVIGFLLLCGAVADQRYQDILKGPFFWQQKNPIYNKMITERFVPVSAVDDKGWSFKGAGIVRAPKSFTFDKAKDFNQLKELKEHFSNIAISSDGRNINLGVRFLGTERVIEIRTKIMPGNEPHALSFEVTGGLMKGLYGVLFVKDIERRKDENLDPSLCEVGLVASFSETAFWVPGFVFGVGAEGIMRHVAISLRDLVEKDYKNQKIMSGK